MSCVAQKEGRLALNEPHKIMRPPKERPLSGAQLRILHNLAVGVPADYRLSGRSRHGALPQTIRSLARRCLIVYQARVEEAVLTLSGLKSHRRECCKMGHTEEDHLVDQVDRRLRGLPSAKLWIYHSDCELMSSDSPQLVRCPACLVGVLSVQSVLNSNMLSRHDTCSRCKQRFTYKDEEIAGKRLGGFSEDGGDGEE